MNDRCDAKSGLFSRCKREMLHPGEHDDGKKRWPRVGIDQEVYLEALEILEKRKQQRAHRQSLVDKHEAEG